MILKKNKTSKDMEKWFEGKKRRDLRKDLLKEFKAYLRKLPPQKVTDRINKQETVR